MHPVLGAYFNDSEFLTLNNLLITDQEEDDNRHFSNFRVAMNTTTVLEKPIVPLKLVLTYALFCKV